MSNTAAHLVDHVTAPELTLRQWVLTVPFELRLLLAAKPEALSAIGRIVVQEIQRWQREHARVLGYERLETAAVSFCQRFGSTLNLNIHWTSSSPVHPLQVFRRISREVHPGQEGSAKTSRTQSIQRRPWDGNS